MQVFKKVSQRGFSVVELMATIIVATLFLIMFYQLFLSISQLNNDSRRGAQASDLAYANLRRYPTISSLGNVLLTFSCSSSDVTLLSQNNQTNAKYPFLGKVNETVTISYPYGCTNNDLIKITSTVETVDQQTKVTHATFIN